MNLFEVVALLLIVIGFAVGLVLGFGEGGMAALLGALRGAAIGFGFYVVWALSIVALLAVGQLYRPSFPRCKGGRCSAPQYRYISLDTCANGHDAVLPAHPRGMLARCGCGTLYLRGSHDRRVWEVAADGSLTPYMRYRAFGRWQPDHGDRGRATQRE